VLGEVDTFPSEPPSETVMSPSCQTARFPPVTLPGTSALNDVETEHVPPTVVLAVAAHCSVAPSGMSETVPGS